MIEFLATLDFPCCLLFDEFEKNFGSKDEKRDGSGTLLSLMDGVYGRSIKHLFLLTTNNTYINDNFISRPGRILYLRTYGSLREETVRAYVSDTLKDPTKLEDIINSVDSLEIITIDILKCIVDEINSTGVDVSIAMSYLNVKKAAHCYDVDYKVLHSSNSEYKTYTEKQFLREIELDGTKYTDSKGKEQEYWFDIDRTTISTAERVDILRYNDHFGWGTIVKPMSVNNVLVVEGNGGQRVWYRVNNPDNLYHNFRSRYGYDF